VTETTPLPVDEATLRVTARYLGDRLDVRGLAGAGALAWSPLVLQVREGGWAVLFRYGAVVLVGLDASEEQTFIRTLEPHVTRPHAEAQIEEIRLAVDPRRDEGLDPAGVLWVRDTDPPHLQVVAEAIAKSAALAHYETEVGSVFTELEPLVAGVHRGWRGGPGKGKILAQLSHALNTQARIMGRVEVTEKPELTWDAPELDRLYERLAAEFELVERDEALTRKTDFMSQSADLLMGMAQHGQTLRVEWYIVILILIEIVLLVFDLFAR
jgi:uncharacterized Rmd1/YagE family protein